MVKIFTYLIALVLAFSQASVALQAPDSSG